MIPMTKKQRAVLAVEALKAEYPDAICSLDYPDPLRLLIAVRLSAQCTDARVNLVTPGLFARFPTLEAFCEGTEEEIGELIRSCGFYNTKSKDILQMCRMIRDDFVPYLVYFEHLRCPESPAVVTKPQPSHPITKASRIPAMA